MNMSLFKVFDVAGTALNAQQVRMNVTASNLANAGSVSGNPEDVYRAKQPIFQTFSDSMGSASLAGGVRVSGITESDAPLQVRHEPNHPDADAEGNVYVSNVNTVEEMVNMISASRSYQNNIEIINTTKDLLTQTLSLGR
jgi:flagellar basal-body rod protein FlgC